MTGDHVPDCPVTRVVRGELRRCRWPAGHGPNFGGGGVWHGDPNGRVWQTEADEIAGWWRGLAAALQALEVAGEDPSLAYDRAQGRSGAVVWDGRAWVKEEQR